MTLPLACALVALSLGVDADEARHTCHAIEHHAETQGFDPYRLAAMSAHEAKFQSDAVNRRTNAHGSMQVLCGRRWSPWVCAQDLTDPDLSAEAGVLMAVRWRDWPRRPETADWRECYAAGGRCRARGYVAVVDRYERQIRQVAAALDANVCAQVGEVVIR